MDFGDARPNGEAKLTYMPRMRPSRAVDLPPAHDPEAAMQNGVVLATGHSGDRYPREVAPAVDLHRQFYVVDGDDVW
jgi:hypothetical protein